MKTAMRKRKENTFINKGEFVEIHLPKEQIAYIDKDDFRRIKNYYWGINSKGYLHSRIDGKLVRLHTFLLDNKYKITEHVNGNKLDNRKVNLREYTPKKIKKALYRNNSSGFNGVRWDKKSSKWRVTIGIDRRRIHLGLFTTLERAIKARKEGEIKYFNL